MCGRFFLDAQAGEIIEHYNTPPPDLFTSRYNIAPTTPVLARHASGMGLYRWGLIPHWAKDVSIGNRMFNARAETVAEKPSFRNAYKRRRCLVPANGFYEWRLEQGRKQPYVCHRDRALFSMAGIWEHWQDAEGNEIYSCSVITTEAIGKMRELHQRMPVYIAPNEYEAWLDCRADATAEADRILQLPQPGYDYYAVSTAVSNSRNEGSDLIEPLRAAGDLLGDSA